MRTALLASTAALLLGAASDTRSPLDRELAGRVAGKAERCIDTMGTEGPEVIDSRTLIYRTPSRLWVNTLPQACPSLNENVIPVVEIYGGQLCADDRFRTLERYSRIPSGYCRLGNFTPYARAAKAR